MVRFLTCGVVGGGLGGGGRLEGFLNDHSNCDDQESLLVLAREREVEKRVGMRLQRRVRIGNQGRITLALYTFPNPGSHDCLLIFTCIYLVPYISFSRNP